jgi:hypothetical protein
MLNRRRRSQSTARLSKRALRRRDLAKCRQTVSTLAKAIRLRAWRTKITEASMLAQKRRKANLR